MRLDLIEFKLIAAVDKSHEGYLSWFKTLNLSFEVISTAVSPYHRVQVERLMQNILAVGLSRFEEVGDEGVFANGGKIVAVETRIVDVRSKVWEDIRLDGIYRKIWGEIIVRDVRREVMGVRNIWKVRNIRQVWELWHISLKTFMC